MATHSSILAWRTPWTEEPGRLQSRGSRKDTTEVTQQQQQLQIHLLSNHSAQATQSLTTESQYLSTWGLGVGEAGTCCKPPNKTQDHQIKLLKHRRSKTQERLTQICLFSLRRWTGPKGLCRYQDSGSSQRSSKGEKSTLGPLSVVTISVD